MDRPAASWVSASDLADYAYCPRSYWYRYHPPAEGPDPASVRRSAAGTRYHARLLRAERVRAERGAHYAWLVGVGVLALVAGIAWWLLS